MTEGTANRIDPTDGIQRLLAEREGCERRIREINVELKKVRDLIDLRTTSPVRTRKAALNINPLTGSGEIRLVPDEAAE